MIEMSVRLFITIPALLASASYAQSQPACPSIPPDQYTGKNLTNTNFSAAPPGSLKGANFNGANLSGAVFTGQDLTGATFQDANLGPSQKGPSSFVQANLTSACFIGAVMNATDFSYAQLNCTDFTGTSLMQANFGPMQTFTALPVCRTKFVSATIDINAIDTANWGYTDFSYANFQNLSPDTFTLKGKDITGAILVGTNFQNIDMSGANLTQVDFSQAALTGANLTNAALNAAVMVGANVDFATLTCARFYYQKGSSQDLNAAICTSTPSTTMPATGANLQSANLTNSVMGNVTLDYALLNWANLSGANFRAATFRQASLEATGQLSSATIAGTNFNAAVFDGAQLNNVLFSNANLQSASFVDTTLAGTSFAGTIMPDANFSGAVLESVNFSGTILQNVNFTGAVIKTIPNGGGSGVSFSCAQLGGSNFTDAQVTQATFANAVMPGSSNCCAAVSGFQNCGTIGANGEPYGPVTYPPLTSPVTCPNGDNAVCQGSQWQLSPNWTTTYCSNTGLPQTLWVQPSCDTAPPSDIVQFTDPNLEQCILSALPGQPASITVATAQQQLEVICPGKGIASLGGLENFTGLQTLDLTGNQITQFDLTFTHLRQLKIGVNKLSQLDLSNMNNIVWLDASDNQLTSVTGMADIYFQMLDLSGNKLTTLDIATQTKLVSADLSNNQITSVTDPFNKTLSTLTNLTFLNLSNNLVSSIGAINGIAYSRQHNPGGKLTTLLLACNPNFACSSLNVDGSYPAYQSSQCADYNTSTQQWVPNVTPNCPASD